MQTNQERDVAELAGTHEEHGSGLPLELVFWALLLVSGLLQLKLERQLQESVDGDRGAPAAASADAAP